MEEAEYVANYILNGGNKVRPLHPVSIRLYRTCGL